MIVWSIFLKNLVNSIKTYLAAVTNGRAREQVKARVWQGHLFDSYLRIGLVRLGKVTLSWFYKTSTAIKLIDFLTER